MLIRSFRLDPQALSKPAFSPTSGKFVVGTEEQGAFSRTQNRLIFSGLDDSSSKLKEVSRRSGCLLSLRYSMDVQTDAGPLIWCYPVTDVRGCEFLDIAVLTTSSAFAICTGKLPNGGGDELTHLRLDDSHVLFAIGPKVLLLAPDHSCVFAFRLIAHKLVVLIIGPEYRTSAVEAGTSGPRFSHPLIRLQFSSQSSTRYACQTANAVGALSSDRISSGRWR